MNTVGTVVASMLSKEDFLELNPGWSLADGSEAPHNSKYFNFVSNKLPDLRGVFLRGRNYDRDILTGNADGDLKEGTFQKFEIASHTHSYVEMIRDNNIDGVDSVTTHSGEHHNETRQTGSVGGNEVRPNCVTVNFFICVD